MVYKRRCTSTVLAYLLFSDVIAGQLQRGPHVAETEVGVVLAAQVLRVVVVQELLEHRHGFLDVRQFGLVASACQDKEWN